MAATSEERGFEDALEAISSLITRRKRADGSNWGDAFALMDTYIKILDLEEPLSKLSVIHVAGTKGKGSTCAFAESILRHAGNKTGMFTSPHLVDVRERFRIGGKLVQKEVFLEHFWWCWDRCQAAISPEVPLPAYFRFLMLLALRIFIAEKVDVALLEVGIGGRYDATNVVKAPVVCGVASLGYDHTELLGDTLPLIAREKAGIFKPTVPAITAPQPEDAMETLQKRADELQIPLEVCPPLEALDNSSKLSLGLAGDHQRINAALAVALCRKWTERAGPKDQIDELDKALEQGRLPDSFRRGLASVEWPGRAQVVHDIQPEESGQAPRGSLTFYLDGAHTPESMEVCANWFCEALEESCSKSEETDSNNRTATGSDRSDEARRSEEGESRLEQGSEGASEDASGKANGKIVLETAEVQRVLLFNCMQEREPVKLIDPLCQIMQNKDVFFQRAIFVPSFSSSTSITSLSQTPDLTWQQTQLQTWNSVMQKLRNKSTPTPPLDKQKRDVDEVSQNNLADVIQKGSADVGQKGSADVGQKGSADVTQKLGSVDVSWDGSGFVMPSLPAALEWLRKAAREQPPVRLQVLVSGSLHLVGDVLRLLRH